MSNSASYRRFHAASDRRGVSTVVASIALVIVLALVGVLTFALLGGWTTHSNNLTCQPADSPACGVYENLHDISLLVPFQSVQQNSSVPIEASLPAGESTGAFTFNFGDGNSSTQADNIIHHTYTSLGNYIVSVTAPIGGLTHSNYANLVDLTVTPSSAASSAGSFPTVTGAIVANSTVTSSTATAVLEAGAGAFVTVNASYSAAPTDPSFVPFTPKLVVPSGVGAADILYNSSSALEAKVSFTTAGIYPITFVGGAADGSTISYENYTWTVFVAPTGTHASLLQGVVHTSPHPGTYVSYEDVPGGAFSEDPAIDYETAGYEPILNVYQTLIAYNGTDQGPGWQNYVPVLATCVPGSTECQNLYGAGNTLVNGNNYTFVIQPNASFYDPSTGNSWGVYPTDVLFSLARTMAFSTLPCVTCNNGWIITQALLDHGNGTWSSIHGSYNNTPQNIYAAITINGTDCPSQAYTNAHGCVTFDADGGGNQKGQNAHTWPYFLELIADGLGSSVVPCGWFSASSQGAGIPYWTQGNVSGSGDHPCPMPGQDGYGLPENSSALPYTGWDHWEQLGSGYFGTYLGHVQFSMAGSGPYYMADYEVGSSYTLKANPAYGSNPDCTWTGCQPAKGQYTSLVEVTWETTATPGEQAYLAGVADFATIPSTDFSLLLQMISDGKVRAVAGPTITIGFRPFNFDFNIGGAQSAGGTVSVPSDFFSYLGMRAFFAYSYPYQTVQTTYNTVHGIELGFLSGGAIPQYMANYYPRDIPWPNQNPCTNAADPSCATYWWDQMQNTSSPYYDPEVATCTSANPCEFPMIGETGNPAGDAINALWSSQILSLTNGAVKVDPVDLNFGTIVEDSEFSGPGQNPLPLYTLGWAPDYPDPTDYVNPLYQPNATYTFGDAVQQQLELSQFTNPSTNCLTGNSTATIDYYAANYVNNTCQGFAYHAMVSELNLAAFELNITTRLAMYDTAEKIAFHLFLYVYTGQGNNIYNAASWVDPSSINANVMIGGGGDTPFYQLTGNGVQYAGST